MRKRNIIRRRIRHRSDGVDLVADVTAVTAVNVNEPGTHTVHVESRAHATSDAAPRGDDRDAEDGGTGDTPEPADR